MRAGTHWKSWERSWLKKLQLRTSFFRNFQFFCWWIPNSYSEALWDSVWFPEDISIQWFKPDIHKTKAFVALNKSLQLSGLTCCSVKSWGHQIAKWVRKGRGNWSDELRSHNPVLKPMLHPPCPALFFQAGFKPLVPQFSCPITWNEIRKKTVYYTVF